MRLRDLGRPWFSWTDLRAIVNRARTDHTMELYRVWNPDSWLWADPTTWLLAEVATMTSEVRYLTALKTLIEVPDIYLPVRYGPHDPDLEHEEPGEKLDEVAIARQVAASMRG